MAYSYFDYEGTGTTIQTDILCVSTEHMYALEVLSEEKSNVTLSDVALAATFTKNNAGVLCELKTAPSTKIRVIRSTPYDVLMHDFSNGAQFNAHSVDEVYEQLLYLCQEIVEGKLIIDSSGIFKDSCISQNELQKQLAAEYSRGYSDGEAAGDAAGYARGYLEGYAAGYAAGYADGDAAGYARGYSEGDAEGYARGYPEGEAAGKAAGEAAGKAAGDAEGYARGKAEGETAGKAAGYARGFSEGEAAGKAACSGSGSGGGSGGGGSTPPKTMYSIYYGRLAKHTDDYSQICVGSIGDVTLTRNFQNYCEGVDSRGGTYSFSITARIPTGGG